MRVESDTDRLGERVVVVIPSLNDAASLAMLIPSIDRSLASRRTPSLILIVDDGSTEPLDPLREVTPHLSTIQEVRILKLRRNLGHQRAIAVGLAYVHDELPCSCVVVMDADGEDSPDDIVRLLDESDRCGGTHAVFAARARRTENALFKVFYFFYKLLHVFLTGSRVRVGNFSVLPYRLLRRVVVAEELWNHYSATIFKLRLPIRMVSADRGRRLAGRSRMNFTALVVHGMSAISVYSDRVGVRMLSLFGTLTLLTLAAMAVVVGLRVATDWAIPGWASSVVGSLTVALLQSILLWVVFVFVVLSGRAGSTFIPLRDCRWFVDDVETLLREPAKT